MFLSREHLAPSKTCNIIELNALSRLMITLARSSLYMQMKYFPLMQFRRYHKCLYDEWAPLEDWVDGPGLLSEG